jgi:TPP-dependent pyruvate/acetoin dehydrogenase alpha subunit
VEKNEFAMGTRSTEAAAVQELSLRAAAYRMRGWIMEGGNVAAMYYAMKEAVDNTRESREPCML